MDFTRDVLDCGIIEWFKIRLDHVVQLFRPDLFFGGVFLELCSRFLTPRSSFKGSFLQQELLEIVCGVEIGLLGRRQEDGGDLLRFEQVEFQGSKEGMSRETVE